MSTNYLELLEEEVSALQEIIPSDDVIQNISNLAERQIKLEQLKKKLDEMSTNLEEQHKIISEKMLPNALNLAGMTEFKLKDGSSISVKRNYFPSITPEEVTSAYDWMVENGHDIIKNEVIVKLPKGQSEQAKEAALALQKLGYTPELKESIHWQTFRAWAKDVMEKGITVPESIKIHVVDKTTVKYTKK